MSISIKLCNRCKSRFPAYVLEQNSGYCEKCYLDSIEKGKQAFLQLQLKSSRKSSSHKEIKTSWVTVIILSSILLVMMISCIPESSNKEHVKLEIDKKIQLFKDDDSLIISQGLLWFLPIKRSCEIYEDAKNDIKRSEIFNLNQEYIENIEFAGIQMWIRELSTTKGGNWLDLQFRSKHNDLSFIQLNIPKTSNIYMNAAEFSELECVKITGKIVGAASIVEKSSVCNPHYRIRIRKMEKC